MRPDSLVDGEGLGLEHNEVGRLGGFEVLEDEASLGHRAPVLLTLVFGEEGHLGGSFLIFLGDPGEDRATQAGVASRSLPAFFSVHLSGALRELHHIVVLSLELLLVVVAVGLEIPDDLVKGLGSLAKSVVVETLDAEGDDTGQDNVLLLDVHLFLGLLSVLFVSQDVAQLGAEDLDGSSLALGNDGESIGVDLTGWRDGDVNDDGDILFLDWWRGHFLHWCGRLGGCSLTLSSRCSLTLSGRCSLTLDGGCGLGGGCLTLDGGCSLGGCSLTL